MRYLTCLDCTHMPYDIKICAGCTMCVGIGEAYHQEHNKANIWHVGPLTHIDAPCCVLATLIASLAQDAHASFRFNGVVTSLCLGGIAYMHNVVATYAHTGSNCICTGAGGAPFAPTCAPSVLCASCTCCPARPSTVSSLVKFSKGILAIS